MGPLMLFEDWKRTEELILTARNGKTIEITSEHGKISEIDNNTGLKFPFWTGQLVTIFLKQWACKNGFKWNGEDACAQKKDQQKKIFGIRTKDVPKGHEWRMIYPNKFR